MTNRYTSANDVVFAGEFKYRYYILHMITDALKHFAIKIQKRFLTFDVDATARWTLAFLLALRIS